MKGRMLRVLCFMLATGIMHANVECYKNRSTENWLSLLKHLPSITSQDL